MDYSEFPVEIASWKEAFLSKVTYLENRTKYYLKESEVQDVRRACFFGAHAHKDQFRSSGEPYIFHPVEVAIILTEVQLDAVSIIGAVLHDVIEDTDITFEDIQAEFGSEVAEIVDGVSKLTKIRFSSKKEAKAENFRKMVLAMTKDIRVIMVKLADRLHNMRTLGVLAPYKKRRIAQDTLDIYAPIASRLGMFALQVELENLCFQNIYPFRAQVLKNAVNKKRQVQAPIVVGIKKGIEYQLERAGITARISMREKHAWSIYRKLRVKGKIEQLYDIFAIRIIVQTVDECYRTLGIVHNLNKPIIGRFKDFIAIPKSNGYQSLHTVVFGANMLPVEIQIRTRDMHVIAEAGAAAHWRYKDAYEEQSHTRRQTKKWLNYVTELQSNITSSEEFMESMKSDLFPSDVYVFTPNGRIIELPKGATPVDFAYAIHSDVGDTCVSAKVDAKFVALNQVLVSGQTVEINTAVTAKPNPAWLDFVVTAKARSAIRAYLSRLTSEDAIIIGRHLLDKALTNKNIQHNELTDEQWSKILKELQLKSSDEMLIEVGMGRRPAQFIVNRLIAHGVTLDMSVDKTDDSIVGESVLNTTITGAKGMALSLGRCCYPLPGDPIIGYLSVRHGVVVHRVDCGHIRHYKKNPDKLLTLSWSKSVKGSFPIQLYFIIHNQRGSVAEVAAALTEMDININDIHSRSVNQEFSHLSMIVRVHDRKHLADAMRHLRLLKSVVRLGRKSYT